MTVSIKCPACSYAFRVSANSLGVAVQCPNPQCLKRMRLRPRREEPSSSRIPGPPQSAAKIRHRRAAGAAHRTAGHVWRPLIYGFGGTVFTGLVLMGIFLWGGPGGWSSLPGRIENRGPLSSGRDVFGSAAAGRSAVDPGLSQRDAGRSGGTTTADSLADRASEVTPVSARTPAELHQQAQDQQFLEQTVVPFLTTHCVDCHGPDEQMAGIAVHGLKQPSDFFRQRKTWEKVYRMLHAGAMPPSDYEPQPEADQRQAVAEFLNDQLFNFDCSLVDHPGRPTIQRLNRTEYNNTIRGLFGVNLKPAEDFPADDVGEGFDNIGDVLTLPPLMMEKYLDAAEQVALAVIDTTDYSKPGTQRFGARDMNRSRGERPGDDGYLVLASNGLVATNVTINGAGRYQIRIEAAAEQAGDEKAKVVLQIDEQTVHEFTIEEHRRPKWFEHEVELTAGDHVIGGAFVNDYYNPDAPGRRKDRNLLIRAIEVTGPQGGEQTPRWHDIHRRFVTRRPDESTTVAEAAAAVLQPIMYRAFRRPVSAEEVQRYAGLVQQQVTEFGASYDEGLAIALQAILVTPDFLFRLEADPDGSADKRPLNDYEIASRLSYFLWSSMPDDDLLQLAEHQRLRDPNVLREQVARMVRDDRSGALAENFAAQWLGLRNLAEVRPDPDVFEDFDNELKESMAEETKRLFDAIVREDLSVDEFLTAEFTFVNERLAKHYGIEGVTGDDFVRVALSGTSRSGVLTQASILTLTSNPARTSPVKRGKWILENILNDAPPPAPPSVPALEVTAEAQPGLSLREQLALHREDPGCASCHNTMDPLGLGLENFDAVGRWRDQDGEHPVDASGTLPGGESFTGPQELIRIIRSRSDQFHRALAERMLTYALGRGLDYYDKCAVDHILESMHKRGNRFSALVEGIVLSDCFLYRSREREPQLADYP